MPTAMNEEEQGLLAGRWRRPRLGHYRVDLGQFSAELWKDERGFVGLIWIWGSDENTGPFQTLRDAKAACERAAEEYRERLRAEIALWER
jgi:hypothetical protein